MMDLKGFE